MTMQDLASKIARIEGKKSQARIGDIREILSILGDMVWDEIQVDEMNSPILNAILASAEKRAKKAEKKKKH